MNQEQQNAGEQRQKHSSGALFVVCDEIRHVRTANERTAENHLKSGCHAGVAVALELLGSDVLGDLADCVVSAARYWPIVATSTLLRGKIAAAGAWTSASCLAQPDHQPRLRQHIGPILLGESQHIERLLIIRLRPDARVERGRSVSMLWL